VKLYRVFFLFNITFLGPSLFLQGAKHQLSIGYRLGSAGSSVFSAG
jgi:hypothetical protein